MLSFSRDLRRIDDYDSSVELVRAEIVLLTVSDMGVGMPHVLAVLRRVLTTAGDILKDMGAGEISKPFDPDTMMRAVRTTLDGAAAD